MSMDPEGRMPGRFSACAESGRSATFLLSVLPSSPPEKSKLTNSAVHQHYLNTRNKPKHTSKLQVGYVMQISGQGRC